MVTFSLVGSFLCLLSVFWPVLIIIQKKKREYISYEMDNGIICYSCKERIEYDDTSNQWPPSTKRELCLQCKRDKALDSVLEEKHTHIFDVINNKNWKYIFIYTSLFAVLIQVSNIFIHNGIVGFIGGTIVFTVQLFNYINFRYNTKKKTQSV